MSEDISNLMNQINHMMKNNEIPDDIKNIINNITNNSQNNSNNNNNNNNYNNGNKNNNNNASNSNNNDIRNNYTNNSFTSNKNYTDNQDMSSSSSSDENSFIPEFDIATIMKMKKIMDSMKSSRDDPRANLLKSLKPYLKDSRKEKVDQYIQIFGMGKVFEMLGPLGGDNHK